MSVRSTLVVIRYTGFSNINIKDFTPVAEIVEDTAVVTVLAHSPFKTIKDRIEKLASVIKEASKDPKFVKFMKTSGLEVKYKDPDDFARLVAEQNETYPQLLQELGLKVNQPK